MNVIYSACHWEERFSQLRKDILLVTLHFLPNCILFNYLSKSQKTKKEMKINYTFPHFLLLVSKMCVGRVTSKFGRVRQLSCWFDISLNRQASTFKNVPWAKAKGASLTDTSLGHCSSNSITRACEMSSLSFHE